MASRVMWKRQIRSVGARFINQVNVPEDDPAYINGARTKLRFEW